MNQNQKQTQRGNFILVLVAMVLGVLMGLMFAGNSHRRPSAATPLQGKMDEVMGLVEHEYVDRVNTDSLSERLLAVMLSELDPHSSYLSARETERADELMRGNFEGVGLVLHREGDTTYVGQVLSDGPSAGLGIRPGDLILCVDGDTVSGTGMTADSVVAHLRGPRGTSVEVVILRHTADGIDPTPLRFKIRRGVIDHKTVPLSTMLDDTTGYILLTTFASTSHEEFRHALRQLKSQGMRHLIFDLRGNGGGSLQSAVGIAGDLLPRGSLIVYTQGAHSRRNNVKARFNGLYTEGRVTVMIDESSASASEVVSGALQDNDRATVTGRRSFGKGLVQTEFSLGDGSSVLLTTARYYTPSGRCIQRPYDEGTDEYYRSYVQQLIDDSYADTAAVTDTTPYYTVGGRVVYGGGGITPDIILPYRKDSSFIYYNRLASAGLLNRVAFDHVKHHGGDLQRRYADGDAFIKNFRTDSRLLQEVARRGEKAGIARNERSLKAQQGLMANMMKAYIGQALFGDAVFYRVLLNEDEDLKKVIGY